MTIKRFWISWYQPTEDYRPLTYPPNNVIFGYWCSGSVDETNWTLCALVDAHNVTKAKEVICKDWPEAIEWRFVEQKSSDWLPNDRFPLKDWMRERLFL